MGGCSSRYRAAAVGTLAPEWDDEAAELLVFVELEEMLVGGPSTEDPCDAGAVSGGLTSLQIRLPLPLARHAWRCLALLRWFTKLVEHRPTLNPEISCTYARNTEAPSSADSQCTPCHGIEDGDARTGAPGQRKHRKPHLIILSGRQVYPGAKSSSGNSLRRRRDETRSAGGGYSGQL